MSAFGSSIGRFPSSSFTGFGGKFRPDPGHRQGLRTLTDAEANQVRYKLRAAAYTHRGVDWERLFLFYSSSKRPAPAAAPTNDTQNATDTIVTDSDNIEAEIGLFEFRRLLRNDAKIPVSQLSDVDIKALFHSVDLDGSGMIDAEEFMAWVQGGDKEDEGENADDLGRGHGRSLHARDWGQSSGYGRVSPRKLASPSQRRYDVRKGWVMNNDENSEAEAVRIRRSGSEAAKLFIEREKADDSRDSGSGDTAGVDPRRHDENNGEIMEAGDEVRGSPSAQFRASPSFIGTLPQTDAELLAQCRAELAALKKEHAAGLSALAESQRETERLRAEVQSKDAKIKDQRRTIAVLNRR